MDGASKIRCVVFGAGGHGRVVADVCRAAGAEVVAFVDDQPRSPVDGIEIRSTAWLDGHEGLAVALGIGDNTARRAVCQRLRAAGHRVLLVVHPSAEVSPRAVLGPGTVVMPRVVVNAGARVGAGVILNSGCIVEHDCVVGDFVHIAPRATLGGGIRIGEGAHVGLGACVIQSLQIGSGALVGAGAVVIDDVRDGDTVVGNPARILPPRVGRSPTQARSVRRAAPAAIPARVPHHPAPRL